MDGVDPCPFTRLNEVDAWAVAKTYKDFYLALYAGLLTDFDVELLHRAKAWGADMRR